MEAKAKIKQRHRLAIEKFIQWLAENPDSTLEQKIARFDVFVDSAKLEEHLNMKKQKAA
jgi:hypothetical protein